MQTVKDLPASLVSEVSTAQYKNKFKTQVNFLGKKVK